MNTKIVFFYHLKSNIYSSLMKLVTGSKYHHVGILLQDTGEYYEMGESWHKHVFEHRFVQAFRSGIGVMLVDSPVEVHKSLLDRGLSSNPMDPSWTYSLLDYLSFIPRRFGLKTRDFPGVICSEKVWDLLHTAGWAKTYTQAPSPGDLFNAISSKN